MENSVSPVRKMLKVTGSMPLLTCIDEKGKLCDPERPPFASKDISNKGNLVEVLDSEIENSKRGLVSGSTVIVPLIE